MTIDQGRPAIVDIGDSARSLSRKNESRAVIGLERSGGGWPARLPIPERCVAAADWNAPELLR